MGLLLILSGIIFWAISAYYMIRFLISRRGTTFTQKIYVSFFWPFLLGKSTYLSEESKRYSRGFFAYMGLFAAYVGLLLVIAKSGRQ